MHGYFEFSGYDQMYALIRHTVRKGSVVIYPRWQTDIASPCPGPFDIEPCMTSAVNGINGALEYLRASAERGAAAARRRRATSASPSAASSPRTWPTATGARPAQAAGDLPRRPARRRPHRHRRAGAGRLAAGIPSSVKLAVPRRRRRRHLRAGQRRRELQRGLPEARAHPEAQQGPRAHPHRHHGDPTLLAPHGVCAGSAGRAPTPTTGTSAGRSGTRCAAARTEAPTAATRSATRRSTARIGRWSDGVPVAPLKIQDAAPIRP